ncbi:hypothetical protein T11_7907 [Trichinella zimbabwensis]|uniref:Uncharacterized protein n=1 Tax=Trichinella zimbabwensis TaxID=268475 RepID=A0A0V1H5F6_9BILA|nr:hypothetical protein T11_7907 [Trichinella zimbabwensis]
MNFQPLIVAGKKLNENAYRELPQDSMNTGKKNEKSCSTSDSSVHSSLQFEAASSTSNLSAAIKQERQLAEARQAVRRRKTFAYDGDISTEIHLTFGISSTEMPSKLEECLQPHSTSSGQSLGHGTMKTRSGSNVSSHKKRSENESEKNLTSRSGRFDVQANVSDKVVGASEANYQKINSAAEGNKDVDGAVLIESNSSKGNAVASENPSYALRNSGRKKSISAQFSSDKKVENSASKTSNSVPSTVNDTVQQFSTSISALNFDEKCSSSFEKAVIKERAEANARQLARRRKTLKSGSNYDEIHLTKEMMQTTSSSNITYTTRSNSRTKSADVNSKAHVATHRTRKSSSRTKSADFNSKAPATSNLVEEDGRMHTSAATHTTRKGNSGAKSDDFNSKAHVDDDGRMHTSVATRRTRKSNSRTKSDDLNSKAHGSSNLVEDDGIHSSVAMHTRGKSNSRAKSATSSLVEEVDRMRTSIASNRTRKSNSRAKSGDFNSKTPDTSNLVDEDDRMHTSLSSALTVIENSKREADNSNLALWNATSESKLAVALPVQDRVFEKTPTTRSKRRCFPFSSTPSTNFKKAEMPDVPFLGDLSTIISLRAPEHEKIKKIRSGMKSRAGSKNCVSPELVESVPRVDCNNDDPTKTALIASSILENSEKIANNGSLSNEAANGKQTIPEVVPAHSFHSPVPSNVQRKNKHKKPERRGKKNIKRYPAFSTPNLQSGKGDVMKYPAFSSSELSSITSLPTKDTNSFKSMDCNKKSNQSKAVVAKNSLSQSSRKQRLSCESTEKQSKRASLKSGSQVCDIAAAGNDFDDIEAVNSENVQQSDAESCQTSNADSDQVMKRSSGCKEIEEIDSKRLADLVSAMSENASVTPISCFKKPSGSLDNTAILKRFGVDSECDDVLYEEEIDELPANRKQSASEKEESEEKMSCIDENTNLSFEKDALPLSSDNLSVGQKRSSTAILHSKTKEVSSENGTLSPLTSFHSETECSESFYPFNARCKKLRKLSISTEGSTSTFLNGSENDSGIVTPKRHPRSTTLFEQLMRRRISSAMNKAASSTERSSSQQNVQSSSTSMNDTSIKHYYENGTPNVSLGYASELPTPKINWGDLRTKTPNVRRSNRTRIPTLRRQLGESVVYRYVNGLPEVERVIHGTVMGKVFLRYGAANSAALVEARRRRRRFLEYRRKMKKLQRERNEALRKRRLSAKESQSSVMGYC